jgi:hypothetical protein
MFSMDTWHRLDTLEGEIPREIRNASLDAWRTIAIAVASAAASAHPELPVEFHEAVHRLRSGKPHSDLLFRINEAADELDDLYLDLHADEKPGGQSPDWETAFRTARAAFAVRFALADDPFLAAADATYETVAALNHDEAAVLEVVRLAKSGSRDIPER